MRFIEVRKQEWKRLNRHHHAPTMDTIDEDVTLIDADTGRIVGFQAHIGGQYEHLKKMLLRHLRYEVKYDSTGSKTGAARLSGMNYESRVFGNTAPQPLRRRYGVAESSFASHFPEAMKILVEFTKISWDLFQRVAPDEAKAHLALVDGRIHDDWLLGGAPFTSGILNNSAALPYHKDSGNIKGTWNNMLAIKTHISGGGLHIPEYGVCLGVPDGSISGFDGQGAWHGVTPFVKKRPDARRFTIVWYTKSGMVDSGSAEEEALKAKRRATKQGEITQ